MIRLSVLLLAGAATPAYAHGALPGAGGFYSGAAHPFVAIDHLILLIALGFVLAQHDLRAGFGLLLAGVAAGMALPFWNITFAPSAALLFIFAIIAGASVALAWKLSPVAALALCLVSSICIGLQTDVPMTDAITAATAGAGVLLSVFLITAYAMAIGTVTRNRLQGVPLRVAGSWIIAIALMMLAFLLRGTGGAA